MFKFLSVSIPCSKHLNGLICNKQVNIFCTLYVIVLNNQYVCRYQGDNPQKTDEEKHNEEKEKLDKLFKKVEKNKKQREKRKEKEAKQKAAKRRTIEQRQFKRELKSQIIPVPENNNDEFIDKRITNETYQINGNKDLINALEGFTVLGDNSFIDKKKVCY